MIDDLINKNPLVLTFSGKAGCGKTTLGYLTKNYLESLGMKTLCISYADFLKMICIKNFGYDDGKKDESRNVLQWFGTDIVRAKDDTFWISTVFHLFDVLREEYDAFIIDDARFENELQPYPFTLTYPIVNIFVERDKETNQINDKDVKHSSENMANNPDYSKYHFIINNSGTFEETHEQIVDMTAIVLENVIKLLEYQREKLSKTEYDASKIINELNNEEQEYNEDEN